MKNFIQPGRVITLVLAAVVAAGDVVVIGDLVGVAASGGAIGDTIAVNLEGVYELPKVGATAFDKGDVLYWDADPGVVTTVATGHVPIGYAFDAALSADTVANVLLAPLARTGAIA